MPHRCALLACTCVLALFASACRDTPTDPSKPDEFDVSFLGMPAGAESFTPQAVAAGRVVGTARVGGAARAVQWFAGAFAPVGPDAPAGCESEALGARVAFTVGQITCAGPGGVPVDAYGWTAGIAPHERLFTEPYGFVDVNRSAVVVGTVNPPAQFPQASPRAFQVQGTTVTVLLPEGAVASEAAGISDDGGVAVTAYYDCEGLRGCSETRAMVWADGEWTEVPLVPNTDRSVAAAVSSAGHVAGYSLGGADGIFLYDAVDDDFDVLPVVPGTDVEITGTNAREQVVGTGFRQFAAPGQQASYGIVWGYDQQYSLSERIDDDEPWVVTSALATDEEGRIAGTGFNTELKLEGAILLVPSVD
ncbi:MAG TPA: hypothetical protein VE871_18630 [Longimicrobium sp.]|nr:hypothetical protein [Longimicrobium sp.]